MKQTYAIDEIIVVDNNSTDQTKYIITKKYPNIRLIHEKQQGVSYARNRGIKESKNEWIAFLDSDDEWTPDKIQLQVELVRTNLNNPLFIHTNEIWIRNGKFINQKNKHKKLQGDIFEDSLEMCLISPSSVLINKKIFNVTGMFNNKLRVCEDYELWIKITCKIPIFLVDKPCVIKYGGHPDQLSQKYWGMDRFRVRALEKILINYKLKKKQKKKILIVLVAKINIILAGAEKRKNIKIIKIYNYKKKYWENNQ